MLHAKKTDSISNSCYINTGFRMALFGYTGNGISGLMDIHSKNFTTVDGLNSNNVWMISVDSMNRKMDPTMMKKT